MNLIAHNDNNQTLFGVISSNIDELKEIAKRLNVELLCDDVDPKDMLAEIKLIQQMIKNLEPATRQRPNLQIVR